MSQPFRWQNCLADVVTSRYREMALSYIRDVVEPSLSPLERQIADMRDRPSDVTAVFGIGPAEELLRATLLGYCLSIQAMWEKQIRGYLLSCAGELKADARLTKNIPIAKWPELDRAFLELRGIPLSAFDEYADLTLLHLLGNVSRHGTGPSLSRLAIEHPELWPETPAPDLTVPAPPGSPVEPVRLAENLVMSLALLKRLAEAVDSFWGETEYIYNESIDRKHWSLEKRLVEERRKRAGRGRPWDPPS